MDTKKFWENRLSRGINLQTTGHRAFSLDYNHWLYQAQVDALELIIQRNQIRTNGASLLDIGSGGGFFVDYFMAKGVSRITGVDIAKPSVDLLCQRFPAHHFYHMDISEENNSINGVFDIISAFSVMFHIIDDHKFIQALQHMCSLMSPSGNIILCDTFEKRLVPGPKHVRMRWQKDYEMVFRSQGVEIVDVVPMYYWLNRVFVPWLGPSIINSLGLGKVFYKLDTRLRQKNAGNWGGMKLLLARRSRK